MMLKRAVTILALIILSILLVARFAILSNEGTSITVRNQTNKGIENLLFTSNVNREGYSIPKIDSHTEISFKYKLGGFNENAANLHHISELGDKRTYSIIDYISRVYSHIYIDIISISDEGELNVRVEAPK